MAEQAAETEVYEAPAMVEVGDFAEVTLGPMQGVATDFIGYWR